jgi:hypothetical protein
MAESTTLLGTAILSALSPLEMENNDTGTALLGIAETLSAKSAAILNLSILFRFVNNDHCALPRLVMT